MRIITHIILNMPLTEIVIGFHAINEINKGGANDD